MKSPSLPGGGRLGGRQHQEGRGVDKPSSLQYGPAGAVNCQVYTKNVRARHVSHADLKLRYNSSKIYILSKTS